MASEEEKDKLPAHDVHQATYGPQGSTQFARLHVPASSEVSLLPTMILIHGGYWKNEYSVDNAKLETLPAALVERGYAVIMVEYRRRDHAGGGWPGSCLDMLEAMRLVDALRDAEVDGWRRIDTTRLVLLGHSAGGHGVLVAAHRAALGECPLLPTLTVAVAPVADLVAGFERRLGSEGDAVARFLGRPYDDVTRDLYHSASPAHSCLPLATPTIIVTGTEDAAVPPDLTRAFAARAAAAAEAIAGAPAPHYFEIDGANHFTLLDAIHPHWDILIAQIELTLAALAAPEPPPTAS